MSTGLIASIASALESPRLVRRLEIICRTAAAESRARYAALFVVDESGRRVRIRGVCATPPFERTTPRIEVARGEAPILWEAIASGRGVVAPAGEGKGPRAIEARAACTSTMALPINVGPAPIGVLLMGKGSDEEAASQFAEDEMVAASEVAAIAGAAIAEAAGPATAGASGELADELKALQADFIASVTHELRTPLTSLLGMAQAAADEQPGENSERLLSQAKRLQQLIEDLLASQRLDQKRTQLPLESVDLAEVAGEVADQWTDAVTVDVDDPEASPRANGHRGALRTILRHLFSNAARHAPGAPVSIRFEEYDGSDECALIFEDAGPGIPEEERERVFERFYRIGRSSSRFTAGTGIGLFLVRRLAEEMNGSARVVEPRDGGTAVEIRLHRAVPDDPPPAGKRQRPSPT